MKRYRWSCLVTVLLLAFAFSFFCPVSHAAEVTKKIVKNSSYQLPETFEDLCKPKAPCFVQFKKGEFYFSQIEKGLRGSAGIEKIVFHDLDKDGQKDAVVSLYFNPPTYMEEDVYYILSSNTKKTQLLEQFGEISKMSVKNNKLVIKAKKSFMSPDESVYTYSFQNGKFTAD